MKIVFISLYNKVAYECRIMSTCLKKEGHEVHIIFIKDSEIYNESSITDETHPLTRMSDEVSEKEIDQMLSLLRHIKPDIVGISVRSPFFEMTKDMVKRIKDCGLDPLIVLGGVHPTCCPEDCIKVADAICIGDGEEAILELAIRMQKKKSLKGIHNIWIREGNKVYKSEIGRLTRLAGLGIPDYARDNKHYISTCPPEDDSTLTYNLMVTRGCVFSCSYCYNSVIRKMLKKPRYEMKPVREVIEELAAAKQRYPNLKMVVFDDDIFPFKKEWVDRFCAQYKEQINLPFFCYMHPSTISEEYVSRLHDAGLYFAKMGIQHGSDRIRKEYYNRNESKERILESARILNKYVYTSYDLITGTPVETESDLMEQLELMLEIPRPFILGVYTMGYCQNYDLTNRFLEEGLIREDQFESSNMHSMKNMFKINYPSERAKKIYELLSLTPDFRVSKQRIREILHDKDKFDKFSIAEIQPKGIFIVEYNKNNSINLQSTNTMMFQIYNYDKREYRNMILTLKIGNSAEWSAEIPCFYGDYSKNVNVVIDCPFAVFTIVSRNGFEVPVKTRQKIDGYAPKTGKHLIRLLLKDDKGNIIGSYKRKAYLRTSKRAKESFANILMQRVRGVLDVC
ncbi:radical SAM protein [Candidatus Woesearchaeota archaeon]|nr:radical SAM protein [Candidatus Woesearchaeota archaeon]